MIPSTGLDEPRSINTRSRFGNWSLRSSSSRWVGQSNLKQPMTYLSCWYHITLVSHILTSMWYLGIFWSAWYFLVFPILTLVLGRNQKLWTSYLLDKTGFINSCQRMLIKRLFDKPYVARYILYSIELVHVKESVITQGLSRRTNLPIPRS